MKSLASNLILLICCSVLFLLSITAISLYENHQGALNTSEGFKAKDLTADILPPPVYLIELRLVVSQAAEGLITPDQADTAIGKLSTDWKKRVEFWRTTLPANLRDTLLGKSYQSGEQLIESAREMVALLRTGNDVAIIEKMQLLNKNYTDHRDGILELVDASSQYAQSAIKTAQLSSHKSLTIQLMGSALAVISLLLLGVWVHRRIFRLLGGEPYQVADIANAVASGNLTRSVTLRQGDTDSVMAAMRAMCEKLTDIIQTVNDTSVNLSSQSVEIADGNLALSARTEQQASALEQTAASMEQMTSTVKQNADNAKGASQLADSAVKRSEQCGKVIAKVVQTMDDISTSAGKINSIIGVIDGIAFQTNILALNAAVEAARAGNQGRGFAVVAGEVRNLAQRSAEAAKEIKQLIESSVSQVGYGNQLVGEAGETMGEVVREVNRVASLMVEITHASAEQSLGIEQVSVAINQMDATTQQNAAMVNNALTTAGSLREQTQELKTVVSQFHLAARH